MSARLVSASENLLHLDELLDALASNLESIFSCLIVRKLVKFIKILRVYRSELLRGSCAIVQLLQLDVSVLGLPSPLLRCRLSVLRCLDVNPLGLLLVRQQQLLGQAVKE